MNVIEAIKTRRSVRSYQDKPVEPEKLQQILEAARLAPSASNSQDWKFIVVQDPQTRQALAKACHDQAFIAQAPIVIAACSTNPTRLMASGQPTAAVDLPPAGSETMRYMHSAPVKFLHPFQAWIKNSDPETS